MPIGDTQAQSYVTKELIRRSLGRHALRQGNELGGQNKSTGKQNLVKWHHTKTPWIRMVSNAVPHEQPEKCTFEWEEATRVYNNDPTPETRFHHVLWGGLGKLDGTDSIMRHTFEEKYSNPFDETEDKMKTRLHRPMPGIRSADITYKGNKGALRKGVINWNCYTLDDLERLEKLYMTPGIKVLIEWGWSHNTNGPEFTSETVNLIPLEDDTLKDVSKVHTLISANRSNSGGCYDGMFGTITNFNWSLQNDLSFSCTTNITDIGDSIFTSTVNSPVINKKTKDADADDDKGFTLTQALKDIKKEVEVKRSARNKVRVETVAFTNTIGSFDVTTFRTAHGTTSKLGTDSAKTTKRHRCYVRFGDIVDVLLNRLFIITSDSTRAADGVTAHAMFSIGGNMTGGKLTNKTIEGTELKAPELPISIISNHKHLISVDPDVCLLPGQIGATEYDIKGQLKHDSDLPSGIDSDATISFNLTQDHVDKLFEKADGTVVSPNGWAEGDKTAGLLCNIFVNIDMLEEASENSQNVGDFLRTVTRAINEACGNQWAFNWTMTDEHPGVMSCVDANFFWGGKTIALQLPVGHNSGIIKNLSMKSSINSNTANALFIANNSPLGDEKVQSPLSNRAIIPLDVDFTLDGISGLQMGTSLAIDYLPAKYRSLTYLFAFNVNHSIDVGKWETIVTCKFRFATSKDGLDLIYLSALPTTVNIEEVDDSIVNSLIDEAPNAGEGLDIEPLNGQDNGMFPRGVFHSLESKGLTIGATGGDINKGETAEATEEDKETFDELKVKFEKVMAKIYHKGTSEDSDNTTNAYSLLQKIIYLPEE